MIAYFYYSSIRMQYLDEFIEDDDYFFTDSSYYRHVSILDCYHNDCPIIDSIIAYVMDVYKKDNIEVCLTNDTCNIFIICRICHIVICLKVAYGRYVGRILSKLIYKELVCKVINESLSVLTKVCIVLKIRTVCNVANGSDELNSLYFA